MIKIFNCITEENKILSMIFNSFFLGLLVYCVTSHSKMEMSMSKLPVKHCQSTGGGGGISLTKFGGTRWALWRLIGKTPHPLFP